MSVRILMVDDEPDAEELFRQNFRREIRTGVYVFDFARSGAEAVAFLNGGNAPQIILILSDINMPGMSGIELLERVRHQWPEIPVFMITAYGDKTTENKAREKGAAAFLTKPVDFPALKERLSSLVAASLR